MNSKDGTLQMAGKILNLLEKIDDAAYRKALPVFSGSSLGNHFRHIFDFYRCLLQGIEEQLIDYSSRERDPQIELQTAAAIRAFEAVQSAVVELDDNCPVAVRADFAGEHRPLVDSSIGRELMFAYDHAIHHLAMIKIGLGTHFPHIQIDENLGVAPSTLKNQSGEQAPVEQN
ncbi:MAG: hypothetical protein AAGD05_12570 [Bacteroidota bacterium]